MSYAHPNSSPSNHSDLEGEFFGSLVKRTKKEINEAIKEINKENK